MASDLKTIYTANNKTLAELALIAFREKWDDKYPAIAAIWTRNWHDIVTFLDFLSDIRKKLFISLIHRGNI